MWGVGQPVAVGGNLAKLEFAPDRARERPPVRWVSAPVVEASSVRQQCQGRDEKSCTAGGAGRGPAGGGGLKPAGDAGEADGVFNAGLEGAW